MYLSMILLISFEENKVSDLHESGNKFSIWHIQKYLEKKRINKENTVPLVNAYDPIDNNELKNHLKTQVHGATTEIIKATDFTTNGYLPKCFLPYYSAPGQLPRKVQIDRLKRLYQSMNIADLLKQKIY